MSAPYFTALFFSPHGHIGPEDFMRGAVLLLAANFLGWGLWWIGTDAGMMAGIGALVTVWCWYCLFAKRLRGADLSPGLFVPIFLGFLTVSYIVAGILLAILHPDIMEQAEALQDLQKNSPQDAKALRSGVEALMKQLVAPYAVAYFLTGALCAFGFNAWLSRATDGPNRR